MGRIKKYRVVAFTECLEANYWFFEKNYLTSYRKTGLGLAGHLGEHLFFLLRRLAAVFVSALITEILTLSPSVIVTPPTYQ